MAGFFKRLGDPTADPFRASSWVAAALIVGGFLAFFLAWRGAAATLAVPLQIPYLVSGGVGGLTLLIAGASILLTLSRRRQSAREFRELGEVLSEAHSALDALTLEQDRGGGAEDRLPD
jgi:hypothetical protein